MSNEKSHKNEADIVVVVLDSKPLVVVPKSLRASVLFMRWGWVPDTLGITPPSDPMDLTKSVPTDWTVCFEDATSAFIEIEDRSVLVQEITLPQPLIVLQ